MAQLTTRRHKGSESLAGQHNRLVPFWIQGSRFDLRPAALVTRDKVHDAVGIRFAIWVTSSHFRGSDDWRISKDHIKIIPFYRH